MIELVASKVYTREQLKEYCLSLMSNKPEKMSELLLLNKLIEVFTEEELLSATWIKQNEEVIAKILRLIIGGKKKL
jgi:hypothetical protein